MSTTTLQGVLLIHGEIKNTQGQKLKMVIDANTWIDFLWFTVLIVSNICSSASPTKSLESMG